MGNRPLPPHLAPQALRAMRADRTERVVQAVAEALVSTNAGGFRRLGRDQRHEVVEALAKELLAGTRIHDASRSALPKCLPTVTMGQIGAVAWRLVFDLEGGPGGEVR